MMGRPEIQQKKLNKTVQFASMRKVMGRSISQKADFKKPHVSTRNTYVTTHTEQILKNKK